MRRSCRYGTLPAILSLEIVATGAAIGASRVRVGAMLVLHLPLNTFRLVVGVGQPIPATTAERGPFSTYAPAERSLVRPSRSRRENRVGSLPRVRRAPDPDQARFRLMRAHAAASSPAAKPSCPTGARAGTAEAPKSSSTSAAERA